MATRRNSAPFEISLGGSDEPRIERSEVMMRQLCHEYCHAARDGDTATVETLLSTSGAQSLINNQQAELGASPLYFAARHGHSSVTGQLIAARCNLDLQEKDGATALHAAAHNGHAAVTELLIAARCNIDLQMKGGPTPLYSAAGEGHASVTGQLIAARCNMDLQDKNGVTPLFLTAQFGHASVAGQLLAARCNMDLQANNGDTPLNAAAHNGHASVTAQLIAACCNINLQDKNGTTPLHSAAKKGDAVVTGQLLAARCNMDLQAKDGATPLHFAAERGSAAVTGQLLAARCNTDLQANNGDTPLHAAAHNGHTSVTKHLLATRCNVDLQTKRGLTSLQLAKRGGHAEIATLIWNKKQATPLLGRRVVIHLLVAKPEFNGRTGTAVSFDDDKGRYSVELDDTSSGASLMIKPCNLLPTVVCSVALCMNVAYFHLSMHYKGSLDVIILLQAGLEQTRNGEESNLFMQGTQDSIATLIRKTQQKGSVRAKKHTLQQVSPEKIKKQHEDADRAMKELLEAEETEKAAAAAGSQEKKQGQKAGKEQSAKLQRKEEEMLRKEEEEENRQKEEEERRQKEIRRHCEEEARKRKEEEERQKEETDFCRVWREPIELLEKAMGNDRKSEFGLKRPWMKEIKETFFDFSKMEADAESLAGLLTSQQHVLPQTLLQHRTMLCLRMVVGEAHWMLLVR